MTKNMPGSKATVHKVAVKYILASEQSKLTYISFRVSLFRGLPYDIFRQKGRLRKPSSVTPYVIMEVITLRNRLVAVRASLLTFNYRNQIPQGCMGSA